MTRWRSQAEQGAQLSDVRGGTGRRRESRAGSGMENRGGAGGEERGGGGRERRDTGSEPPVLASLLQTLTVEAAAKAQGGAACQPRLFSLSDK